ncbi:G-protein coupled receptor 157-like [Lineus longissimus]|uniref:G-protein coupled receptor 157-like n=1 Tax=Lineus longissimus TaxID=88925 RepID=UPI00315DCB31
MEDVTRLSLFAATNVSPISNSTIIITPLNYAYLTLTCLMSTLSALGTLLIIWTYFLYPQTHNTCRRMLVHLSIADFLMAVGNFLGVPEALDMTRISLGYQTSIICVISGTIATISSISSFLWTSVIAVYLYICIVQSRSRLLGTKTLVATYITCWLVPVIVAILANIYHVFGYDPSLHHMSSCWISSAVPDQLMWQFLTGKAWEIVAYFVTGIFYALVKYHVYKEMRYAYNLGSQSMQAIYRVNRKMTFVPLVFILLRIWGTIRFLIGVVDHSYASSPASTWIVVMQGFGDSSQGFANCVLFCFCSPKLRQLMLTSFRKWTTGFTSRKDRTKITSTMACSAKTVINTGTNERAPLLQDKNISSSNT